MKKIKVYIASPYTNGDHLENVNVQMDMYSELMDLGFLPFAPLYTHYIHTRNPKTYDEWMEVDYAWIDVCDCVLRLPGESGGADLEDKHAQLTGKPVFYSLEDLIDFYKNQSKEVSEIDKINDKYLRLRAEFDNFKKRTQKEKMELVKSANENVLLKILPIIDNFERAIEISKTTNKIDIEGVNLIYNNFKDFIKENGIKEIEAIGKDLNTDLHEAITSITSNEDKGKIVDVIEKGYTLNEKVIRFSKVVVSK